MFLPLFLRSWSLRAFLILWISSCSGCCAFCRSSSCCPCRHMKFRFAAIMASSCFACLVSFSSSSSPCSSLLLGFLFVFDRLLLFMWGPPRPTRSFPSLVSLFASCRCLSSAGIHSGRCWPLGRHLSAFASLRASCTRAGICVLCNMCVTLHPSHVCPVSSAHWVRVTAHTLHPSCVIGLFHCPLLHVSHVAPGLCCVNGVGL